MGHIAKINSTGTTASTLGGAVAQPVGVALDHSGNLYVADFSGTNTVYKLASPGFATATVFATPGFSPGGIIIP